MEENYLDFYFKNPPTSTPYSLTVIEDKTNLNLRHVSLTHARREADTATTE